MPTTINGQTYYTPPELAAQVGKHRATVTRWCRIGLIPNVIDLGEGKATRWLIPVSEVETFKPPKLGRPFENSANDL